MNVLRYKQSHDVRPNRRIPSTGYRLTDTHPVNTVETQDIASLQSQSRMSVETRFIVSSPYFPPYPTDKTTSVASGIPSSTQPYYLIYYMKGMNKGLRLDVVCTSLATEVISFDIRSKIRYGATISGIPVQPQLLSSWGGNPLGLHRSVEDMRSCRPASRSGCIPDGMLGCVVECLSTEQRIPLGCRPVSANDIRRVNPVETQDVESLQTQSQTVSVETRFIASPSPHFPPYLINKTTSVAQGISTPTQPYYLIYYMKRANKGIRLDVVYAPLATEVISFDIRSKIRYGATISGIPVQSQLLSSWGGNHTTAGIRLPKSPVGDSGGGTGKRKTRRSADGRRKTRTLFEPCISVETASSVC